MNTLARFGLNLLLPGYGFFARVPLLGVFFGGSVALVWLFAWPFAIPYHLFIAGCGADCVPA